MRSPVDFSRSTNGTGIGTRDARARYAPGFQGSQKVPLRRANVKYGHMIYTQKEHYAASSKLGAGASHGVAGAGASYAMLRPFHQCA